MVPATARSAEGLSDLQECGVEDSAKGIGYSMRQIPKSVSIERYYEAHPELLEKPILPRQMTDSEKLDKILQLLEKVTSQLGERTA